MANFTATQSISVQGLCATLISTDTSDYTSNIEGITPSDIQFKRWTFRDSNGVIIKQETKTSSDYSSSCNISLLTFGVNVELYVYVTKNTQGYSVQNNFFIPCLGV